jgi:apolipoprotein N-acyltransferase
MRLPGFFLLIIPVALSWTIVRNGWTAGNFAYVGLLGLHAGFGVVYLAGIRHRRRPSTPPFVFLSRMYRVPEILFVISVVDFLFVFIFATNANMDYVQRFIASGGNLHLAPDSLQERLWAVLRFVPLLTVDAFCLVLPRIASRTITRIALGDTSHSRGRRLSVQKWALPMSLLSAGLYSLSFPSFLSVDGFPEIAYLSLVPLFIVLEAVPVRWGVFYGTAFGVLQTMITNYWLGTFDLVSLQFASAVTFLEYVPFFWISLLIQRRSGRFRFLVFPAAWTVFDYLRSQGFLGYPWDMLGTSQYSFIPLIQTASLTGIWGVTFLVTLFNSVLALGVTRAVTGERHGITPYIAVAAVFVTALGWGVFRMATMDASLSSSSARKIRLALVQQNGDPRKDDYRHDFDTLRSLTDQALSMTPDLVVWSETAFVPNIRRWIREDPTTEPLAALVRDFLAYQKSTMRWLLTGNDDYELVETPGGEQRIDYNASVLFSPDGRRVETYHKIHLVPFTEYFPFTRQLPGIFALLQSFDVHLWEPGRTRIVFHIPQLSFSTPICFEDVFPSDVRGFVREGAEAIINLSNDYWSLTAAEAMQHAVNGLFRAVENARPLARASASGLTCLIDPLGRIVARAPFFEKSLLTVDMRIPIDRETIYTRWGDWFPAAMVALLLAILFSTALHRFHAGLAMPLGKKHH